MVFSDYDMQMIFYYGHKGKATQKLLMLFDRGRMQRHEGRLSEDSPPRKKCSKTIFHQYAAPSEARFKVIVFPEMHKQLALRLHKAVLPVCIFTTPVAVRYLYWDPYVLSPTPGSVSVTTPVDGNFFNSTCANTLTLCPGVLAHTLSTYHVENS